MRGILESVDVVAGLMAVLGGIARYLQLIMDEKSKFNKTMFIGHMVVGGFTGYTMANFSAVLGLSHEMQSLVAAWGGVVGLKAFELIQSFISKKMG